MRDAFESGRGLACHALSTGRIRLLRPAGHVSSPRLLPSAPSPRQAAVALDPPPPHASRLGGSSTYTQLFKQRLTIIDESDRAWPVQVRGGAAAGGRCGEQRQGPESGLPQSAGIGSTLHALGMHTAASCSVPPFTVLTPFLRPSPAQYEGFLSSGQRHYRLTSGWVGLMRAQQVGIGACGLLPLC